MSQQTEPAPHRQARGGSFALAMFVMVLLLVAGAGTVWLLFGILADDSHDSVALARALAKELDRPGESADRRAVFLAGALGDSAPEVAFDVLRLATRPGHEPMLRQTALMSLTRVADRHGPRAMRAVVSDAIEYLRDDAEERQIQELSAYLLGFLEDSEAEPALIGALGHASMGVRCNAAASLARLGNDAGIDVLREMLLAATADDASVGDAEKWGRTAFHSMRVLKRLKPQTDFSPLFDLVRQHAHSSNVRLRAEARDWLARNGL